MATSGMIKIADLKQIAEVFTSSTPCVAGRYYINAGTLYKCKTDHNGAWDAAHFEEVKIGNEVSDFVNNLIVVSDEQPVSTKNKIWIDSDSGSVQVPTYTEFSSLASDVADKLDAPSTAGTNGQVLTSNGQGGQSWQTLDNNDAVSDVQIDSTSIVDNTVASIPYAKYIMENNEYVAKPGVVKVDPNYGVAVSSANHKLYIQKASSNDVKAGTDTYKPIVSSNQHASAFYGLAKAAGDTTQALSSNAVGTYTDDASEAIRGMIGAADDDELQSLKDELTDIQTATSDDIGKALSPKTVSGGKVTEWQFKTFSGGGSGVFVVNAEWSVGYGSLTLDKTWQELKNAYDAGIPIFCKYQGPDYGNDESTWFFNLLNYIYAYNDGESEAYSITGNGDYCNFYCNSPDAYPQYVMD